MKLRSAAALLVLLAVAGCGGKDEGSFAKDYNRAVRPLSRLEQHLGTKPAAFDRLARRTAETRRNLAQLDPPAGAKDELDAMLHELDRVTSDLRRVAKTARGNDVVKQRRAAGALVRSSNAVQQAETRLKRAVQG
jgi:hypothetical protein